MSNEIQLSSLGDYLTIKEAAEYLGVSRSTLRNWDKSGKLKTYRHPLNDYRLYQKKELEGLLKKVKNGNTK